MSVLQRLAEPAAEVLCWLLHMLTSYYLDDEMGPTGRVLAGTQGDGVALEEWIHIDGKAVPAAIREGLKPSWHIPRKEEVGNAE